MPREWHYTQRAPAWYTMRHEVEGDAPTQSDMVGKWRLYPGEAGAVRDPLVRDRATGAAEAGERLREGEGGEGHAQRLVLSGGGDGTGFGGSGGQHHDRRLRELGLQELQAELQQRREISFTALSKGEFTSL